MPDPIIATVLCGGAGTRLWPLSTPTQPKQFHALVGAETMFADTLRRLAPLSVEAPILAITGAIGVGFVADAAGATGVGRRLRTIVEPAAKNTFAPALLAAHIAQADVGPNAQILLAPADHHIALPDAFLAAVQAARPLAAAGRLVTFGVRPTHPHTGYGYIERGDAVGAGFEVRRFREKPDLATAQSYLDSGGFDWNAGIFLYRADWFIAEAMRLDPVTSGHVAQAFSKAQWNDRVLLPEASAWAAIKPDSIDYAIAEKTNARAVVPVDIGWSDVGSFATLHTLADKDGDDNVSRGTVVMHEARGNYVRAESGKPVALIGVDDLVVIDAPDGLIIVPRARAEEIKHIVAALAKKT
jgi:mannose-1-phosphate guanylyltransferase